MKHYKNRYFSEALFYLFLILLPGCAQQTPSSIGNPSEYVGIPQQGEQTHVKDQLTAEDLRAMAADVTEKMMRSRIVRQWQQGEKIPILVVAVPKNATHDASIKIEDLQDDIVSMIHGSGIARIIDVSQAPERYEYIISIILSDIVWRGTEGSRFSYYTCKLQLFSLRGERLGQWYGKIGLMNRKRTNGSMPK